MTVLLEQAGKLIMEKTGIMPEVRIPLAESYGRILARDLAAATDFPPFHRSPLDGYAVKFADVCKADSDRPVSLRVVDYVTAGNLSQVAVRPGTAVRIMTGAKIPAGADAVIRLEDTLTEGKTVKILTASGADQNICRQGEEFRQGETILTKGAVLRDGAMGILAMFGQAEVTVYQRPRVAILATGSEVIDVNDLLETGKIHDSNSYMLAAKVREAGGEPVLLGQVPDVLPEIVERLRRPDGIDLYLTTGGASVGDLDLMGQLFERLDIQPLFTRLAIKPGMPVLAGCWGESLLVALSGNPAAAGVSFEVLVRPLLRKLAGAACHERGRARVVLSQPLTKTGPVRRFVWASCAPGPDGRLAARPLLVQRNGMLAGLILANALLDIPAGSPLLPAGTEITARLF
ncbi:molybdopterin molybdotransferase MoeA|uniref:Molybdopterin molybdenumtransferase n=1 Tax=Dendrosporobacter quercicolus TaxID=146817 RepID=A0A1H0AI47_9FIRM|nr:gephyrin-like molybdotransferase Glp [Dendrosporobacter quercicolus]NSL50060.1 molybdopterin molybdotransferase MoeA [Dendrosporobacter quercicolus DSM 1736]SDN33011.1 molybdopterin molybdochelatase [Dendrosporobacter quercicolus]